MLNTNEQLHPPWQFSKTNNSTDMMIYAAKLTKDTHPYDLNKNLLPKPSLKQNSTVSYNINATNDFRNMINTKKKQNNQY